MSDASDENTGRPPGTEWSDKIPSILDPPNAERVRTSLSRGIVFGLHLIYYGGSGPRLVAFGDWVSFQEYVLGSKPGDRFLLWSVEDVARCGMVLGSKRGGQSGSAARIAEALGHTFSYANSSERDSAVREVFAIRRRDGSSKPECLLDDLDILESLENFLVEADAVFGSWYVVQFAEIDPQNAPENSKHLLVDAKRSDGHGAVPLSGYY